MISVGVLPSRLLQRAIGSMVAFTAIAAAGTAGACTLAPGTKILDNYQLVERATAIAVAEAVEMRKAGEATALEFRTMEAVKGMPPPTFSFTWGRLGDPVPSDPGDIATSNDESAMGACSRYTFAAGSRYVIFLERMEDGSMQPSNRPYSRYAEDYSGAESLWMRTIRIYLDIQRSHPGAAALETLEKLRLQLVSDPTPDNWNLAGDILRHLRAVAYESADTRPLAVPVKASPLTERLTMSMGEARGLPPRDLARKVLGEFADTVVAASADGDTDGALFFEFALQPMTTSWPEVCEETILQVSRDDRADFPKIDVQTRYRIVKGAAAANVRAVTAEECAREALALGEFFVAGSVDFVHDLAVVIGAAKGEARSSRRSFVVACEQKQECADVPALLDAMDPTKVGLAGEEVNCRARKRCLEFYLDRRKFLAVVSRDEVPRLERLQVGESGR